MVQSAADVSAIVVGIMLLGLSLRLRGAQEGHP
jgi:hypothetical protein